MDIEYVQTLRFKLQKRFRNLNNAHFQVYHAAVKQFWQFLSPDSWKDMLEVLYAAEPNAETDARAIFETNNQNGLHGETERESACLGAHLLRMCASSSEQFIEAGIGRIFERTGNYAGNQAKFTEVYVQPLYEYLDEQLDDAGATLSLIRKYKQKVEWFGWSKLLEVCKADTRRGENLLGMHLYEYLHDQGLSFYLEPASASGEVDMIASQTGDRRLLLDAKIFDPVESKPKSHILTGFNQVYKYCSDYNESVGYLAIFKTTVDELQFELTGERQDPPRATLNGKTIFFVVIDISESATASKAGKVKAHTIKNEDLIQVVES